MFEALLDKDAQGQLAISLFFTVKSTEPVTIDGTPTVQRRRIFNGRSRNSERRLRPSEQGALSSNAYRAGKFGNQRTGRSIVAHSLTIHHSFIPSTAFTPAHFG